MEKLYLILVNFSSFHSSHCLCQPAVHLLLSGARKPKSILSFYQISAIYTRTTNCCFWLVWYRWRGRQLVLLSSPPLLQVPLLAEVAARKCEELLFVCLMFLIKINLHDFLPLLLQPLQDIFSQNYPLLINLKLISSFNFIIVLKCLCVHACTCVCIHRCI